MRKIIILLEGSAAWLICAAFTFCMIYLASLWVRQNVADQLSSRYYYVMLTELKERIESGLKLGVDLADVPGVQNTLRRMLERDQALYALEVIGTDNIVVFSTDRGSIGEALPDNYLHALSRAWSFFSPYETFHTATITDNFGENAGQVLLSANRQQFSLFGSYRPVMVMSFFLVLLLMVTGGLFWLSHLLGGLSQKDRRNVYAIEDYLDKVENQLEGTLTALQALEKHNP